MKKAHTLLNIYAVALILQSAVQLRAAAQTELEPNQRYTDYKASFLATKTDVTSLFEGASGVSDDVVRADMDLTAKSGFGVPDGRTFLKNANTDTNGIFASPSSYTVGEYQAFVKSFEIAYWWNEQAEVITGTAYACHKSAEKNTCHENDGDYTDDSCRWLEDKYTQIGFCVLNNEDVYLPMLAYMSLYTTIPHRIQEAIDAEIFDNFTPDLQKDQFEICEGYYGYRQVPIHDGFRAAIYTLKIAETDINNDPGFSPYADLLESTRFAQEALPDAGFDAEEYKDQISTFVSAIAPYATDQYTPVHTCVATDSPFLCAIEFEYTGTIPDHCIRPDASREFIMPVYMYNRLIDSYVAVGTDQEAPIEFYKEYADLVTTPVDDVTFWAQVMAEIIANGCVLETIDEDTYVERYPASIEEADHDDTKICLHYVAKRFSYLRECFTARESPASITKAQFRTFMEAGSMLYYCYTSVRPTFTASTPVPFTARADAVTQVIITGNILDPDMCELFNVGEGITCPATCGSQTTPDTSRQCTYIESQADVFTSLFTGACDAEGLDQQTCDTIKGCYYDTTQSRCQFITCAMGEECAVTAKCEYTQRKTECGVYTSCESFSDQATCTANARSGACLYSGSCLHAPFIAMNAWDEISCTYISKYNPNLQNARYMNGWCVSDFVGINDLGAADTGILHGSMYERKQDTSQTDLVVSMQQQLRLLPDGASDFLSVQTDSNAFTVKVSADVPAGYATTDHHALFITPAGEVQDIFTGDNADKVLHITFEDSVHTVAPYTSDLRADITLTDKADPGMSRERMFFPWNIQGRMQSLTISAVDGATSHLSCPFLFRTGTITAIDGNLVLDCEGMTALIFDNYLTTVGDVTLRHTSISTFNTNNLVSMGSLEIEGDTTITNIKYDAITKVSDGHRLKLKDLSELRSVTIPSASVQGVSIDVDIENLDIVGSVLVSLSDRSAKVRSMSVKNSMFLSSCASTLAQFMRGNLSVTNTGCAEILFASANVPNIAPGLTTRTLTITGNNALEKVTIGKMDLSNTRYVMTDNEKLDTLSLSLPDTVSKNITISNDADAVQGDAAIWIHNNIRLRYIELHYMDTLSSGATIKVNNIPALTGSVATIAMYGLTDISPGALIHVTDIDADVILMLDDLKRIGGTLRVENVKSFQSLFVYGQLTYISGTEDIGASLIIRNVGSCENVGVNNIETIGTWTTITMKNIKRMASVAFASLPSIGSDTAITLEDLPDVTQIVFPSPDAPQFALSARTTLKLSTLPKLTTLNLGKIRNLAASSTLHIEDVGLLSATLNLNFLTQMEGSSTIVADNAPELTAITLTGMTKMFSNARLSITTVAALSAVDLTNLQYMGLGAILEIEGAQVLERLDLPLMSFATDATAHVRVDCPDDPTTPTQDELLPSSAAVCIHGPQGLKAINLRSLTQVGTSHIDITLETASALTLVNFEDLTAFPDGSTIDIAGATVLEVVKLTAVTTLGEDSKIDISGASALTTLNVSALHTLKARSAFSLDGAMFFEALELNALTTLEGSASIAIDGEDAMSIIPASNLQVMGAFSSLILRNMAPPKNVSFPDLVTFGTGSEIFIDNAYRLTQISFAKIAELGTTESGRISIQSSDKSQVSLSSSLDIGAPTTIQEISFPQLADAGTAPVKISAGDASSMTTINFAALTHIPDSSEISLKAATQLTTADFGVVATFGENAGIRIAGANALASFSLPALTGLSKGAYIGLYDATLLASVDFTLLATLGENAYVDITGANTLASFSLPALTGLSEGVSISIHKGDTPSLDTDVVCMTGATSLASFSLPALTGLSKDARIRLVGATLLGSVDFTSLATFGEGAAVRITGANALTSFSLPALTGLSEDAYIGLYDATLLASVDFTLLATLGENAYVEIRGANALASFSLPALTGLSEGVSISIHKGDTPSLDTDVVCMTGATSLASFSLPALTGLSKNARIRLINATPLASVDLSLLATLGDDAYVIITGANALTSLSLPALTGLSKDAGIGLYDATLLASVDFTLLATLGENAGIRIRDANALASFSLPALTGLSKDAGIGLYDATLLTSVDFALLATFGDDAGIRITGATSLTSFSLPALQSFGGNGEIDILGVTSLTMTSGLGTITTKDWDQAQLILRGTSVTDTNEAGEEVVTNGFEAILDLRHSNSTVTTVSTTITDAATLLGVEVKYQTAFKSNLQITNAPQLKAIVFNPPLTGVGGSLEISGATFLANIDFSKLVSLTPDARITISGATSLTALDFPALTDIGSAALMISNVPELLEVKFSTTTSSTYRSQPAIRIQDTCTTPIDSAVYICNAPNLQKIQLPQLATYTSLGANVNPNAIISSQSVTSITLPRSSSSLGTLDLSECTAGDVHINVVDDILSIPVALKFTFRPATKYHTRLQALADHLIAIADTAIASAPLFEVEGPSAFSVQLDAYQETAAWTNAVAFLSTPITTPAEVSATVSTADTTGYRDDDVTQLEADIDAYLMHNTDRQTLSTELSDAQTTLNTAGEALATEVTEDNQDAADTLIEDALDPYVSETSDLSSEVSQSLSALVASANTLSYEISVLVSEQVVIQARLSSEVSTAASSTESEISSTFSSTESSLSTELNAFAPDDNTFLTTKQASLESRISSELSSDFSTHISVIDSLETSMETAYADWVAPILRSEIDQLSAGVTSVITESIDGPITSATTSMDVGFDALTSTLTEEVSGLSSEISLLTAIIPNAISALSSEQSRLVSDLSVARANTFVADIDSILSMVTRLDDTVFDTPDTGSTISEYSSAALSIETALASTETYLTNNLDAWLTDDELVLKDTDPDIVQNEVINDFLTLADTLLSAEMSAVISTGFSQTVADVSVEESFESQFSAYISAVTRFSDKLDSALSEIEAAKESAYARVIEQTVLIAQTKEQEAVAALSTQLGAEANVPTLQTDAAAVTATIEMQLEAVFWTADPFASDISTFVATLTTNASNSFSSAIDTSADTTAFDTAMLSILGNIDASVNSQKPAIQSAAEDEAPFSEQDITTLFNTFVELYNSVAPATETNAADTVVEEAATVVEEGTPKRPRISYEDMQDLREQLLQLQANEIQTYDDATLELISNVVPLVMDVREKVKLIIHLGALTGPFTRTELAAMGYALSPLDAWLQVALANNFVPRANRRRDVEDPKIFATLDDFSPNATSCSRRSLDECNADRACDLVDEGCGNQCKAAPCIARITEEACLHLSEHECGWFRSPITGTEFCTSVHPARMKKSCLQIAVADISAVFFDERCFSARHDDTSLVDLSRCYALTDTECTRTDGCMQADLLLIQTWIEQEVLDVNDIEKLHLLHTFFFVLEQEPTAILALLELEDTYLSKAEKGVHDAHREAVLATQNSNSISCMPTTGIIPCFIVFLSEVMQMAMEDERGFQGFTDWDALETDAIRACLSVPLRTAAQRITNLNDPRDTEYFWQNTPSFCRPETTQNIEACPAVPGCRRSNDSSAHCYMRSHCGEVDWLAVEPDTSSRVLVPAFATAAAVCLTAAILSTFQACIARFGGQTYNLIH
jgi:hypothetical protein